MGSTEGTFGEARRFVMLALLVYVIDRIVVSLIFIYDGHVPFLQRIPAIPFTGFVFSWILPILITYCIEKRDARYLGLAVPREKFRVYAIYALIGLILPALFVRSNGSLAVDFIEQIVYIGVAEEIFSRGYLMTRFCGWLGNRKGLVLNAFIFGFSHIISRMSQHGFNYLFRDAMTGVQTFFGGLLLGFIYLRSKNIVPGSIFHVSTNVYIPRLLELMSK